MTTRSVADENICTEADDVGPPGRLAAEVAAVSPAMSRHRASASSKPAATRASSAGYSDHVGFFLVSFLMSVFEVRQQTASIAAVTTSRSKIWACLPVRRSGWRRSDRIDDQALGGRSVRRAAHLRGHPGRVRTSLDRIGLEPTSTNCCSPKSRSSPGTVSPGCRSWLAIRRRHAKRSWFDRTRLARAEKTFYAGTGNVGDVGALLLRGSSGTK